MGITVNINVPMIIVEHLLKPPQIHMETDLSDLNKAIEMIQKQREKRGVLVYACGEIFKELEL